MLGYVGDKQPVKRSEKGRKKAKKRNKQSKELRRMVKLNSWDDINKATLRRHLPPIISAREMKVYRLMESVFSGENENGEAHQCGDCGNIFFFTNDIKNSIPKDWLGNPRCPKCGNSPDDYKNYQWRRKFNAFHEITKAIQRFEASEPAEKFACLKEVKEMTKEFFKFDTILEMYTGYYQMMTELGMDDFSHSLKPQWKATLDNLFERAKTNLAEFLKFILSVNSVESKQIFDTVRAAQLAIVRMEKDYFLSKILLVRTLIFTANINIGMLHNS